MAFSVEQRVIIRLRPQLIQHLHPFTDIIVNRLQGLGLLTESMKQQVLMSNCTSMQQCRNLLDVMVRRGSQFFTTFLQCLNDVGHGYMAQHLKNTCIAFKQGSENLPVLKIDSSSAAWNHTSNDKHTHINEASSEQLQNHKLKDEDEDMEVTETITASTHQCSCSDSLLHINQMFQHLQDVLRHYNNNLREIERTISTMMTRSASRVCICKIN